MTTGLLLDTCIVVAAERGEIDFARLADRTLAGRPVAISAITAAELLAGTARRPSGLARTRAERTLEDLFKAVTVVPVDLDVARVHAALGAELAGRGATLGAHDLLIAATALSLDYDLATRDRAFERVPGLVVHLW